MLYATQIFYILILYYLILVLSRSGLFIECNHYPAIQQLVVLENECKCLNEKLSDEKIMINVMIYAKRTKRMHDKNGHIKAF
jgi:hypothetical protein